MGSKHRDSKDFPDSPRDWGFRESLEQELRNRKSLREDFVYKDFDTAQYVRPNSPPPFIKKSVVPSGPIGKFNSFDPPEDPKTTLADYVKPDEPAPKLVKLFDLLRQYSILQVPTEVRINGVSTRHVTKLSHKRWVDSKGIECQWDMTLPTIWDAEQMLKFILQHEKHFHGKRIKIHEGEDG